MKPRSKKKSKQSLKEVKVTKELIVDRYTSGSHPTSFGGVTNLARFYAGTPNAKKIINAALTEIDSYSRHREIKRPKFYNPTFIRTRRKNFQSDLIQLNNLSQFNRGINFLLIIIDSFTKKIWVAPLKRKAMNEVSEAFELLMDKIGSVHPKAIVCTDFGKEYLNRKLQEVLSERGLKHINPSTDKCSIVERANLSLKKLIMEYLTTSETRTYIHKLTDLVEVYNSRYHRTIKMSPNEAEKEKNRDDVIEAFEEFWEKSRRKKKRKPKFSVGDLVRFANDRGVFRRGYDETHKIAATRVRSVLRNLPEVMYELEEWDGEPIIGRWYETELTLTEGSNFKVEKVLRKRVNKQTGKSESMVKWLGYPAKYNEWIDSEELKNV
jgi:hypothetical protein